MINFNLTFSYFSNEIDLYRQIISHLFFFQLFKISLLINFIIQTFIQKAENIVNIDNFRYHSHVGAINIFLLLFFFLPQKKQNTSLHVPIIFFFLENT